MLLHRITLLLLLLSLPLLGTCQGAGRLVTVKLDLLGPMPYVGDVIRPQGARRFQFAPMLSAMSEWRVAPGHGVQLEAGIRHYERSWDVMEGWWVLLRDWRLSMQSRHYWGERRMENRGWFGGGMLSMGRYRSDWFSVDLGGGSDTRLWMAGGQLGRKWVAWGRLSVDVQAGLEAGLARAVNGAYPYTGQTSIRGRGRTFYGRNFFVLHPTLGLLVGVAL